MPLTHYQYSTYRLGPSVAPLIRLQNALGPRILRYDARVCRAEVLANDPGRGSKETHLVYVLPWRCGHWQSVGQYRASGSEVWDFHHGYPCHTCCEAFYARVMTAPHFDELLAKGGLALSKQLDQGYPDLVGAPVQVGEAPYALKDRAWIAWAAICRNKYMIELQILKNITSEMTWPHEKEYALWLEALARNAGGFHGAVRTGAGCDPGAHAILVARTSGAAGAD